MCFFFIYRIFTFVYEIVHNKQPSSNACNTPAPEFGIAGIIALIIGLVIIGWKLRKAHDAYFIKREFFFIMLIAVVVLPSYVIAVSSPSLSHIGGWGILLTGNALIFVRLNFYQLFLIS